MGMVAGWAGGWAVRKMLVGALVGASVCGATVVRGQAVPSPSFDVGASASATPATPLQLVRAMVAHEDDERAHLDQYEFLSNERSERTDGHRWTERVVETKVGRLRLLLAVDGKPLSADQEQVERARLATIVADPDAFLRREQAQKDDEANARKMLDMLPEAFLFDDVRLQDGVWKMNFYPNPKFTPHGIEDRVLYGMSGWVAIDARQQRLLHIEGSLKQNVSIGFGLLATIRAGSRFSSTRSDEGGHWRTVQVLTDIRGQAALFKSVSRNSDITRSEFVYLEPGITLRQAAALLESPDPAVLRGRRQ